tara:strand:- start:740 stop:970 length:231 start_codon:yes stop_codon:yes gene_type:complete
MILLLDGSMDFYLGGRKKNGLARLFETIGEFIGKSIRTILNAALHSLVFLQYQVVINSLGLKLQGILLFTSIFFYS